MGSQSPFFWGLRGYVAWVMGGLTKSMPRQTSCVSYVKPLAEPRSSVLSVFYVYVLELYPQRHLLVPRILSMMLCNLE